MRFRWVWLFVIMLLLAGCQPSYWVLEKDRIGEGSPDLEIYANYLQMHDGVKGYQVFIILEGKKWLLCLSEAARTKNSLRCQTSISHLKKRL
ncbi:integrase [Bacillus subtilis subsp. subtilis]|nr:integrase [Bacillus subtilis]OTQ88543.1 integrase [Bacillus subtilis subsp. subtilis]